MTKYGQEKHSLSEREFSMPDRDPISKTTEGKKAPEGGTAFWGIKAHLIGLILLVLIPMMLSQLYFFYDRYQYRKRIELQSNLELARAAAKSFETFVLDILHSELFVGLAITPCQPISSEDRHRMLESYEKDNPAVQAILWVNPAGQVLSASPQSYVEMDASDVSWFQAIRDGREWAVSELILEQATGKPAFMIARGLRSEQGDLLGMIAASLDPDGLGTSLGVDRVSGGSISLLDNRGMLVYRYPAIPINWEERNWLKVYPSLFSEPLEGRESIETVQAFSDKKMRFVAAVPISLPGWVSAAGRSEEEALGPIIRVIRNNIAISVLIALASLIAALAVSNRLSAYIRRLQERALAVGRGEYDFTAYNSGPRELRDLARVFNAMAIDIVSRETERAQHLELIESELRRRQQAEEELQQSEGRLRLFIEHAPAPLAMFDHEMRYICFSQRWLQDYHLGDGDLTGYSHYEIFPEIPGQWKDAYRRALSGEVVRAESDRFERADGSEQWLRWEVRPWRDRKGHISGIVIFSEDITERKEMEIALRLSEERYRGIVEVSPELVALIRDQKLLYMNSTGMRMLGANNPEAVIGRSLFDFLPGEFRTAMAHRVQTLEDSKSPPSWIESRLIRFDGTVMDIEATAVPTVYEDSPASQIIMKDITARKQAQEALRLSEEMFARVFACNPAALALTRLKDGLFLDVNETWMSLTGYNREDAVGHSARRMAIWPCVDDSSRFVEKLQRDGAIEGWEQEFVRKSGEVFVAQLWAQALTLHGEEVILTTLIDITERKHAERTLQKREHYFRTLLHNMHDDILVIDRSYRVIDLFKDSFLTMDLSREDILGKHFNEVLQGFDPSCSLLGEDCMLAEVFESGTALSARHQFTHRDGKTVWADILLAPFKNESGGIENVIGAIRSITQEVHLEKQLRQAQKMEAVGTLAGGIAHDFNNILSAILGFSQLSLMMIPGESRAHEYLQDVVDAGNRAKDLVLQILAFSRQQEHERKPLQVNHIVKEVMKLLRASLPSSIEIENRVESSSMVMADPTQFHQIVMNLCTNAAHAMQPENKGYLRISLVDVEIDKEFQSRYPSAALGPNVKLSIEDTGCGMDAATMERMFDPYFTTKKPGEGTGLGLAVVHGIVSAMGGLITVYSEPGQGTIFNVFLPVLTGRDGAGTPRAALELPISRGDERILLVDDEPTLCKAGKGILENLGYQVEVRSSSVEALEVFRTEPDGFDLVITDLTMPGMTGVELAAEVKRIRPDIRIVLCTGFSERIRQERLEASGIAEVLLKPLLIEDMAKMVRRVMDMERSTH